MLTKKSEPFFSYSKEENAIIERQNKQINRHITAIPLEEEEQQAEIPEIIAVEKRICLEENIIATLKDEEVSLAEVLPNDTVTTDKDINKDFVGFLLNLGERPHELKEDKKVSRTFETEGVKSFEDEKEIASENIPLPMQAWVHLPEVRDEGVVKIITLEENNFHVVARDPWDLTAKFEVNMTQVGTFEEECDISKVEVANDTSPVIEYVKLSVDISNVEEGPLSKSVVPDVALLTNKEIENTDIAVLEKEIIASEGAMYIPSNEAMFNFEDVPFSLPPWVYISKVQEISL
jgi:hypothetical protein